MTAQMLHTNEESTCPVLDEPDNYHFEARCEDCDVKYLSGMSLGQVEDRYNVGRVTQDEYEAYTLAWALLSPTGNPAAVTVSDIPAVRRIARKLIRAKGLDVPAALIEVGREDVELAGVTR